ncbi:hypothetical protein MATR_29950 [Marivirga tractuosa]|uniref:Lipoprotein n=1 Tax=Marivirga tractuosa (strain ATCC 23168 / DSM 4126 / NBRC 15989 / NCIMB 1408 / VKM B-1430 / H-43) TaxID=643867 RepID=E4TV91_MARTH|nr:hypothetical protein [Marivirga tractuosa]ADR23156.1 hypothetical protein Ftrac_3182 [Marivirga tractuosa DSM 4126]BDD16170.1 hypothetical protein MATR_29950 [Marivirga tractuosa]
MKLQTQYIFIILSFLAACTTSAEKTTELNDPIFRECDSLIEKASLDFENGIRDYTIMGTVYATEFEMFYFEYMKEHHDVTIKASCVIDFPRECYQSAMNSLIEKELGEDIIEKTRKAAKEEF